FTSDLPIAWILRRNEDADNSQSCRGHESLRGLARPEAGVHVRAVGPLMKVEGPLESRDERATTSVHIRERGNHEGPSWLRSLRSSFTDQRKPRSCSSTSRSRRKPIPAPASALLRARRAGGDGWHGRRPDRRRRSRSYAAAMKPERRGS